MIKQKKTYYNNAKRVKKKNNFKNDLLCYIGNVNKIKYHLVIFFTIILNVIVLNYVVLKIIRSHILKSDRITSESSHF